MPKPTYSVLPPPPANSPELASPVLTLTASTNYETSKLLHIPAKEQQEIADEFIAHQYLFGFQSSNVQNQFEHLCFLLQNARDRYGADAYAYIHARFFSNYRRWVSHINAQRWCFQTKIVHHFHRHDYDDKSRLQDLVLWLLIWGEAANCRHLPEFLCFLFYHMSMERTTVINSGQISVDHSKDMWFHRTVIHPTYQILQNLMHYYKNNGALKDHLHRPHYDDVNEYFWNRHWLDTKKNYTAEDQHKWWGLTFLHNTMKQDRDGRLVLSGNQVEGHASEKHRKDSARIKLKTHIERRSWLNLWRSFDRIVELHLFALHILLIFAYDQESDLRILFSAVLTLAGINFLAELLEIYFFWGIIFTNYLFFNILLRIVIKGGICLVGGYLCYIDSDAFVYAAAGYLGWRVIFELINIQNHRWLRKWDLSENVNFESRVAGQMYGRKFYQLLFWVLVFGVKCIVSYYSYILPLKGLSALMLDVNGFIGEEGLTRNRGNSYTNIFLLIAVWVPTMIIYLIDTQIFYSTFIVVLGLILGVRDKVAYIRSWNDVQNKWMQLWRNGSLKFFPQSIFSVLIQPQMNSSKLQALNALRLPVSEQPPWQYVMPLWSEIISEMRASDYLSYHDEQLLSFAYFRFDTNKAGNSLDKQDASRPPLPPRPSQSINNGAGKKPVDFYFLPSFVTCGQLSSFMSCIGAEEERYKLSAPAKANGNVVGRMRTLLKHNEILRVSLDEMYVAITCFLQIFVPNSAFDPTEGNKLLDYCIRQPLPASFLADIIKNTVNAITESIAICFDLGLTNIIRERPESVTDATKEEVWVDRSVDVNTKTFVAAFSKLYAQWKCIEMNLPPEKAVVDPNLPIDMSQLREMENNGGAGLLRTLYHMLLTSAVDARPQHAFVSDRLFFFLSSLNSNMPNRLNSINEMYSWSVLTPYVDELVLYTEEELTATNEHGVTQEFYLQCLHRKEWANFLERMKIDPRGSDPAYFNLQKREWCSYRGQTLLRTVRGMMFYEKAIKLLALLEMGATMNPTESQEMKARSLSRRKFQYVLSCQKYGAFVKSREMRDKNELIDRKDLPERVRKQRKKQLDEAEKCDAIEYLLRKWPHLRIAYVDERTEKNQKVFYSVLIKAKELSHEELNRSLFKTAKSAYGVGGEIVEVYRVQLPGNILLGEGKPENQNHAIIFTRGEFLQAIDMNQDNYFEEALKMRNLLEEFDAYRPSNYTIRTRSDEIQRHSPVGRHTHSKDGILKCAILGFRETIFTANLTSVGTYMSLMESTFVTITLRTFSFFGTRFHYGHPDILDKVFFITRGGMSKSCKMLHVSEDIFAGFKSVLRDGRIVHHEYIQCGKGRDVGFNQLFLFEAKLASGAGEMALSREVLRLGRYLDLPRLLSFFYGSVGFYATTALMAISIVAMLFARTVLALTAVDDEIQFHDEDSDVVIGLLSATSIYQLGILLTLPMIAEIALEKTLVKACTTLVWMILTGSPLFFFFHMMTKTFFFNNSIIYGGAKYRATGRGFVLSRDSFKNVYRRYARSHIYMAMKVLFLLITYGVFYNGGNYFSSAWAALLLCIAFLFAPLWYNPMAFDHDNVMKDFSGWKKWLSRESENEEDSWLAWWKSENEHIGRMPTSTKALLIFCNFIFPFLLIVSALSYLQTSSIDNYLFFLISYGGTMLIVLIAILPSCFNPTGNGMSSYRVLKFFLFACLIGCIVITFVLDPAPTYVRTVTQTSANGTETEAFYYPPANTRGKNFAIYLLVTLLTLNSFAKILTLLGAGPYYLPFVLTWHRGCDAVFGLIVYLPLLFISLFDFLGAIQTRLLYNLVFFRGLQARSLLLGSASTPNGPPIDKPDKRPSSRFAVSKHYPGQSSQTYANEPSIEEVEKDSNEVSQVGNYERNDVIRRRPLSHSMAGNVAEPGRLSDRYESEVKEARMETPYNYNYGYTLTMDPSSVEYGIGNPDHPSSNPPPSIPENEHKQQ